MRHGASLAVVAALAGGVWQGSEAGAAAAAAGGLAAPWQRPALVVPRALRAVTLDVARAGRRLVAVGERGVVQLSDDNGAAWRQVPTPVSVTLTAVRFADQRLGWAVGHAGVVLRTQDGGEHWARQLDGEAIAALLGKRRGERAPALDKRTRQFIADGPDKPLLDLYVKSAREVVVVGAYGLALKTVDGGASWLPWMDRFDNQKGLHLNAIGGRGELVVVVGEQGLVQRSTDGGERFVTVAMPYNGSFFAVQMPPDGSVVVAGLRGQAFRSTDAGLSFQPLALPAPTTVNAMALTDDGGVLFGTQAGMVIAAGPAAWSAVPLALPAVPLMSALVVGADGGCVAAGAYGPMRLEKSKSP